MNFIFHILRVCVIMLFSALGTSMTVAVPMVTSEISFYQAENTPLTQSQDVGFAVRAPPLSVANVAVTGGITSMQGSAFALHGQETVVALFGFSAVYNAPNRGFGSTDAVTVSGTRAIDKAQSYESGVRSQYTDARFSERQFSAVVDGQRVNGVADDVTIIGGKPTAIEAKFTDNWATSPRNPDSSVANLPFAVTERNQIQGDIIPNTGSLQSRVDAFKEVATPILTNPTKTSPWKVGNTNGRGFLGSSNGKNVFVVVATEGPKQGKVITSFVPDANQLSIIRSR